MSQVRMLLLLSSVLLGLSCSGKLTGSLPGLRSSSPSPSPSSSSSDPSAPAPARPSSGTQVASEEETAAKQAERQRERDREAEAAAGMESKIKKSCTFRGAISKPCADVQRDIDRAYRANKDPDKALLTVDNCYREARQLSQDPRGGDTMYAGRLIADGREAEPVVAECLRLIDDATGGPAWRAKHNERVAYASYLIELNTRIERDFVTKCGVPARLDDNAGLDVRLVLMMASKKTTVFHTARSPRGETHTILCNGHVRSKNAQGQSRDAHPVTEEQRNQEGEAMQCMLSCAQKHLSCASSKNATIEPCKSACKRQCEK